MAFAAMFRGTAAPDHVQTLRRALAQLAREARTEPGTLRYEFYQPADDPLVLILFAVWENEADWQAHLAAPAHKRYVAALPPDAWANPPAMTRLHALEDSASTPA